MKDFRDKVAVITGGASGIGLALGRELAQEGMAVALLDLRTDMLDEAVASLRETGARVMGCQADVTRPADMERAADSVERAFGRVDLLANNAGVVLRGETVEEVSDARWDWILRTNLMGAVYGIRTFLPRIRQHGEGGHVLNTSSIAGFRVRAGRRTGAYSVSKYALVALSEALEHDLAGSGIGVSLLVPAAVATNIYRSWELGPGGASASASQERVMPADIADGMDSAYVARRVCAAIRREEFFIFTHLESQPELDVRHQRITQAYEATRRWIEEDAEAQRA